MPVYEWQRSKPLRNRGRVAVGEGEAFRAPDAVGKAFGDLLEEREDTGQDVAATITFNHGEDGGLDVERPDDSDDSTEEETDDGEDETEPDSDEEEDGVDDDVEELLDGTLDEVREGLDSGEFDDRLDMVKRAEKDGKRRKGVRDAIKERRKRD